MPSWHTQGSHRLYHEADLLFFEFHGVFELADVQHMYVAAETIVQEYGYILALFDASKATGMTAESRRYVGDKSRAGLSESAAAVVGASFPIRALVMLMRNASRLIGRPQPPMQFCASPEEGLAWLTTQRPIFRAKVGQRS